VVVLELVWAAPYWIGKGVGPEDSIANEAGRKGAVWAAFNDASLAFLDIFRRDADRTEIAGDDSS